MQSGGYDYEFVHAPSDTLICQICHFPSKEPHLSACCGHTFCKSCLEAAKSVKFVTNSCPMCRNEQFATIPNKQADRIIRGLLVYCSNKNRGCEWKGELNSITAHMSNSDGCQFHEVNCPNECGTVHQRQYLTNHVETERPRRKTNCQYCHDAGEHQFIEGQHKEECPKFPLPCPNWCGVDYMPRGGMREHINNCPQQLIQCKYHMIGCEVIMARKDQKEHDKEMMEEHLSLSVTNFHHLSFSVTKILANQHDAQKTIHYLTDKLATAEEEIAALKQLVKLTDNNDKVLAKAEMKKSEMKKSEVKKSEMKKAEMKFQSKLTGVEAVTQKHITKKEANLQSLFWHSDLENKAAMSSLGNEIIPVFVKMSEFTKKKKCQVQWFSASFYTHSKGYKIQLKVLPDGEGHVQGSHVTVCLFMMKGPYDEQLQWPMKGKYEVKLLNQFSNTMHHSITGSIIGENSYKPTSMRNRYCSWYSKAFISHETLTTSSHFLKDDNLYFKVSKLS